MREVLKISKVFLAIWDFSQKIADVKIGKY